MTWQINWKSWGLQRSRHYDYDFNLYENYLIIGPFQMHWYS